MCELVGAKGENIEKVLVFKAFSMRCRGVAFCTRHAAANSLEISKIRNFTSKNLEKIYKKEFRER